LASATTPDGTPYAFVHTLDFGDGVWCLEVDPLLALDEAPGALAAAGDRLYVASANGFVGSFRISSITDPSESPEMDWVVWANPQIDTAPVIVADGDGVVISYGDASTVRVGAAGTVRDGPSLPGSGATALVFDDAGAFHAIGTGWSTIPGVTPPDWLGEITRVLT
jgi:hypothetical protein